MRSRSHIPIKAAQRHLDAARRCLERAETGLSAAEAYYAMYHVVAAAAVERGDDVSTCADVAGELMNTTANPLRNRADLHPAAAGGTRGVSGSGGQL